MCPRAVLRPSKALEGVHGVQVAPHSPFAFEEINQHGDFQSTHGRSFITANQPLFMQVWQQRPSCLKPVRYCCMQGDRNLQETVVNVLTSLPFIALGIQAPRKNLNTKLYANSLIGVGVASSLYHSSRGKLRKYFRWADYTMIATATVCFSRALRNENPKLLMAASAILLPVHPLMVSAVHTGLMEVAFAKRALKNPELRMVHNVHKISSLLGGVLFIADDVFPKTPFIHAAWHLAAAVGVSTCNKLLEMGCRHVTDLNLSLSFNNAKPSPLIPNPTSNHASNANEGSQQTPGSSRWNPTPEQLLTLEELYRRGTRTPSATQIQQIAARLQRFGKIEGKNVFYWFQNHKARERQKRRRQLSKTPDEQQQQQCDIDCLEKKESAVFSLSCNEIEPRNNKASPSDICKLSEGSISTHGVAKSGGNEWMQIHDKELRLELSCSATASSDTGRLCPSKPHQENITSLEEEDREEQTLELFPLGTGINISNKDTHQQVTTQFFEFLPLKN